MSETDIVQGGAVADTAANPKPRGKLPTNCFACSAPVMGPYCYNCGQKNDDCRRSIVLLAGQSASDLIALDGKVMRTVRSVLLRPGRHVREYGDGKRSPYSPPVRFFLVVSFLFFFTLWITDTHLLAAQPKITTDPVTNEKSVSFSGGILKQAENIRYTDEDREYIASMIELEESALVLNGRSVSRTRLMDRLMAVAENPGLFNDRLNEWIPRMMIIMIPLLALLGSLFIRGKDAMIYDHLILSLDVHAVAFLILTVGLILSPPLSASIFALMFFFGLPVYYLVALKGAFRRSGAKTVFAGLLVWGTYALTLNIALGVAVFLSFVELL